MSRIKKLDHQLIDQIAAGEVVERPASIVKELIENSIDAGATQVEVELKEGGVDQIVVRDNGCGISLEDAKMTITRHATSKVSKNEDLFDIQSLGFRGEALASISSVSKFTLVSSQENSGQGFSLSTEGGKAVSIQNRSAPTGTTIVVEDLFYNIPARKKFLKATTTEYSYCAELLRGLSLIYPEVGFSLLHNNKTIFDHGPICHRESFHGNLMGEDLLRKRFEKVMKVKDIKNFVYIHHKDRFVEFEGLVSAPGFEKSTSKNIHTYINRRRIADKMLRASVFRGYHSHILKGKYPQVFLSLYSDPGLVDVNVHPAKTEVRFQFGREIGDSIAKTIRSAIRQGAWASIDKNHQSFLPAQQDEDPILKGMVPKPFMSETHGSLGASSSSSSSVGASKYKASTSKAVAWNAVGSQVGAESSGQASIPAGTYQGIDAFATGDHFLTSSAEPQAEEDGLIEWSDLSYMGQFAKCYLFFEQDQKLLVVDQHAWHERILYEKLIHDPSLAKQSQKLLIADELSFSELEVETLKRHKKKLLEFGFEYELDSVGLGLSLSGVPSMLKDRNHQEILEQICEKLQTSSVEDSLDEISHLMYATIACHSAARSGDELGRQAIDQLIQDSDSVDFFHNCPHGRRVLRWFSKSKVNTWFDR